MRHRGLQFGPRTFPVPDRDPLAGKASVSIGPWSVKLETGAMVGISVGDPTFLKLNEAGVPLKIQQSPEVFKRSRSDFIERARKRLTAITATKTIKRGSKPIAVWTWPGFTALSVVTENNQLAGYIFDDTRQATFMMAGNFASEAMRRDFIATRLYRSPCGKGRASVTVGEVTMDLPEGWDLRIEEQKDEPRSLLLIPNRDGPCASVDLLFFEPLPGRGNLRAFRAQRLGDFLDWAQDKAREAPRELPIPGGALTMVGVTENQLGKRRDLTVGSLSGRTACCCVAIEWKPRQKASAADWQEITHVLQVAANAHISGDFPSAPSSAASR